MYGKAQTLEIQRQSTERQHVPLADSAFAWLEEAPKAKPAPVVLVAEDDADMRALLSVVLRRAGYKVLECKDGWDLLRGLDHYIMPGCPGEDLDLIISDIRMPGVTGMEILELADIPSGFPPMILITAFGDRQTHAEADQLGAVAVFDKPFDMNALLTRVGEVIPPLG
jgi:DNA-binding response OmpR family regulator